MIPSTLKSVLVEYKRDANIVASWLATTARARHVAEALIVPQAARSSRPKGKERKKAKDRAVQSQTSQGKISARSFVQIARSLAGLSNPAIAAPTSVRRALQRAILTRERFSAIRDQGKVGQRHHRFFIDILKEVDSVLAPFVQSDSVSIVNEDQATSVATVRAAFSALSIDDISRDQSVGESTERAVSETNEVDIDISHEAETDANIDEVLSTFKTLLHDLNDPRSSVRALWKKCHVGQLDVAAVAVATNIAINLARDLESASRALFESHAGIQQPADIDSIVRRTGVQRTALESFFQNSNIYIGLYSRLQDETTQITTPPMNLFFLEDDAPFEQHYESLGEIFCGAFAVLSNFHFRCVIQGAISKQAITMEPGSAGHYNPDKDRSSTSPAASWHEDKSYTDRGAGRDAPIIENLAALPGA